MNGVVYFACKDRGHYFKVGRTKNLSKRMADLGLCCVCYIVPRDGNESELERRLHRKLAPFYAYAEDEVRGVEWFAPTPDALAAICSVIGREPTDYLRGKLPRGEYEYVGTPADLRERAWGPGRDC